MTALRVLLLQRHEYAQDPDVHASLLRWARAHGINPDDVVGDQLIEVDDEARQIHYQALTHDDDGQIRIADGEAITERRTVQLEAPALPLPDLTAGRRP